MSTTQSPQDEIAAMQATLALHAEDLERIKQWLPEIADTVRHGLEQQAAEFAAVHERIEQELNAIRERQDAQDGEIASIKESLAVLVARTDQLAARTDQLATRTDEVVDRLDAMSRTLNETNSRVGNLTGTRYERRVARIILRRPSRSIGLSPVQVLHTDWGETDADFLVLLRDADSISDDEYEDVLDSDIIIVGQNSTGRSAYAVVEISITVSSADVNRAARRARTLARATGDECSAVVVGSEIPSAEQERAQRSAVAMIAIAERVE